MEIQKIQGTKLQSIVKNDPTLFWYVSDISGLDDSSIFEQVLNYGTWKQVQEAIGILGLKQAFVIYSDLKNKQRSNIFPQVKNYFDLYFANA